MTALAIALERLRARQALTATDDLAEASACSGSSQALNESDVAAEAESACASRWIICSTKL
jgi:hypothetical protein